MDQAIAIHRKGYESFLKVPDNAQPLCSAVFKYFGRNESRDADRKAFEDAISVDYRYCRVRVDWTEGSFQFRSGPLTGSYRPWNLLRFFDATSGWTDEDEKKCAKEALAQSWQALKTDLLHKLYQGELRMLARPNPLEEHVAIEVDSWPHYDIKDWEHGRAEASGNNHIFSIYLVPGEALQRDGMLPIARPDRPLPPSQTKVDQLIEKRHRNKAANERPTITDDWAAIPHARRHQIEAARKKVEPHGGYVSGPRKREKRNAPKSTVGE